VHDSDQRSKSKFIGYDCSSWHALALLRAVFLVFDLISETCASRDCRGRSNPDERLSLNTARSANCQLPEHALALRAAGQVELQAAVAPIGSERYPSGLRYDQRVRFGDEARLPAADAEPGALHSLNPCTSSPGSGRGLRDCRGRSVRGGRSSRQSPVRSASSRRPTRRRACGRCAGWCGATPGPSRNP
jgi:hypothetical protein